MPGSRFFGGADRSLERLSTLFWETSALAFDGPAERGLHLFVITRRINVRQSLQLFQGLQIEILITSLWLSGLFP
jgi:hypothetical protein